MKIGDKVLIKGTINEIRKDVVIIENDGGYFGTVPSEIIIDSPTKSAEEIEKDRIRDDLKVLCARREVSLIKIADVMQEMFDEGI